MTVEDSKSRVLRFYELMNARKYDEMWSLFLPDAKWGGVRAEAEEFGSTDNMKAIMVDPMPIFVDGGIQFTVHALTAEDERVADEVESFAPLVNGKVYNNHYHMLFELRDGKIAVVKEYADTAHARDVFGDLG